jgi:hypothetical protein
LPHNCYGYLFTPPNAIKCISGKTTIISGIFSCTNAGDGCLYEDGGPILLGCGSTVLPLTGWKSVEVKDVEVTAGNCVPIENFAISNSNTKYEMLDDAAADVEPFGTITMLQNVTIEGSIPLTENKPYTIDFGVFTYTSSDIYALGIYSGALTLTNGSVIQSDTDHGAAVYVSNGVTVHILSGYYEGTDNAVYSSGTVNIRAGRFVCTDDAGDGSLVEEYGLSTPINLGTTSVAMVSGVQVSDYSWKNNPLATDVTITSTPIYNPSDVVAINSIIANNGLAWTLAEPADGYQIPTNWTGIVWTSDATNKRVIHLDVQNQSLTGTLDVSALSALKKLYCQENNLDGLYLSNNLTALEELYCFSNPQMTTLDVSTLTALQKLHCQGNGLSMLNLSNLATLEELNCENNSLTTLELSDLTALKTLVCQNNLLTGLDLSAPTALEYLSCHNNELETLALR